MILHILTKHRKFKSADSVLREILDSGSVNFGSELFEALVYSYRVCDSSPRVFDLVFKTYAHLRKIRNATDVFCWMKSYGFLPTVESCKALLSSLLKLNRGDIAVKFYKEMQRSRISSNVFTFNMVVAAYCKLGKLEKAVAVFKEMESLGFNPTVASYNTLIGGYCKQGLLSSALKLKDSMIRNGVNPTDITYNTLIHGLCEEGKLLEANKIFNEMKGANVTPNTVTYNTLINGYCQVGNNDMAGRFFEEMSRNEIKADILTYNALILGLCKEGMTKKAAYLVKELDRKKLVPNSSTFSALIIGQCARKDSERAYQLYKSMIRSGCHPNEYTLNVLMSALCGNEDYNGGVQVLREMLDRGSRVQNYTTGCASICNDGVESASNGSCSGIGCCQISLPVGARDFSVEFRFFNNSVLAKVPCSSAFVVEDGFYNFSVPDLNILNRRSLTFPVLLDWAVRTETCAIAKKDKTSYACVAPNSICTDSGYGEGTGYRCNCPSGYEGNPYLNDGCIDIDECATSNPCDPTETCRNQPLGSYECECPPGHYKPGDGREGCDKITRAANSGIAIGVSTSLFLLVVGSSWIYWLWAKRKHIKQKEKFFAQNGGFMLREAFSKDKDLTETARLFTEEDLKKATSNFDETGIIGRGGYGTVYKGVLSPNNIAVAIKKSKQIDQSQSSQFINEVIILSRINHINVVKLIGCCLETEVPMLVYEFVNNGTLSDRIHGKDIGTYLSWESCLQISAEIAGAVAYLHSAASPPIIHRDIKSNNILLDENFIAKVADFGASKVVPRDHAEIATLVQGTFGYMDPEYFHSSELTEKSDVYSFGVLLAELLTGEPAISFDRPEKDRSLAMYFISSMRTGNGMPSIIQKSLVTDEKNIQQIKQVALLAARCLNVTGDKRPSMKEVATELEGLKTMVEHPWVDKGSITDHNETEYLLKQSVLSDAIGSTSFGYSTIVGFDNTSIEMSRKVQFR